MTPVFTGFYLLTGATGAIGKEIARDLASKGEKLILAVRNMDKPTNSVKSCSETIRSAGR